MIETKLNEEAREALRQMIGEGAVHIAFNARNPETTRETLAVEFKAKRKLFSKTGWKVRIDYGDGRSQKFAVNGSNEIVEEQFWQVLKTIDGDFLQAQRREALGL